MADTGEPSTWLTDRTGLTLLALVSALLAALIVLPYLQYVLLGVVLAYILVPVQRRIEEYVPRGVAALALVVVAILAILLPIVYLLGVALQEALEVVAAAQDGSLDLGLLEQRLEEVGYAVDLVDFYETYEDPIGTAVQGLATGAIAVVGGLPGILIGLTVTLFVLFALLRDREALLAWIRRVLPVREELQNEMFAELDQLMWASVVGNVAVAIIQALLLGFGLAVLGVPAVAFLTVTTFVLALLPLVGAFGVWIPVSVYLLAIGRPLAAVFLVGYGSLVSASDMYLRPALIGRTGAFNSATIVVGIFGGLVIFGAVGLFIGPVVLGGAKIVLDVFARERAAAVESGFGDETPEDGDFEAAEMPAVPPETGDTPAEAEPATEGEPNLTAVEWDAHSASAPVDEPMPEDAGGTSDEQEATGNADEQNVETKTDLDSAPADPGQSDEEADGGADQLR